MVKWATRCFNTSFLTPAKEKAIGLLRERDSLRFVALMLAQHSVVVIMEVMEVGGIGSPFTVIKSAQPGFRALELCHLPRSGVGCSARRTVQRRLAHCGQSPSKRTKERIKVEQARGQSHVGTCHIFKS